MIRRFLNTVGHSSACLPEHPRTGTRRKKTPGAVSVDVLEPRLLLYALGTRWPTTATDGGGLSQGDPTTVTWGIADDGTWIWADGTNPGEQDAPSDLVAFLSGIFGTVTDDDNYTDEAWFSLFEDTFNRWGELSGLTFVYEPNDDAQQFLSTGGWFPGVLGTRADIRIGGHPIDGNGGVLAYAYQPDSGELIFDTTHSSFSDSTNNYFKLRTTLAHELGHALGLKHVSSSTDNFLMEATLNTSFDGPQYDDVLGIQRWYGDDFESGMNNSTASPTALGALTSGSPLVLGADGSNAALTPSQSDIVSIDDESDIDVYSFSVTGSTEVDIALQPVGPTYMLGSSSFNAASQSDLTLQLIGTDGSTVLQTANLNGIGGSENITGFTLPSAGTYFVSITGATANKIQTYQLSITAAENPVLTVTTTPQSFSESAGADAATGTVTRNGGSNDSELVVTLSSSDTGEATVPVEVTIPAGQDSAPFSIDAVDDSDVDGTQTVTLTASATGYSAANVDVDVTDDDVPNVPTVTGPAAVVTSQRPTITWTSETGADSYDVWIGNQSTGVNPFHTATVTTNSWTPDFDFGIGRFNVWIRATNGNGSSEYSTQYDFRIATPVAPAPLDRWQTTWRPTISWASLPGADKYDIWVDDHLGGVSQYIRDTNVTDTQFTPASDMGIGLYRAWVRGIDAGGTAGYWSSMVEFYVATPPDVTGGQNPTFDATPTFSWNASPGAERYEVFIRDRNTGATVVYEQSIHATEWTPSTDLPNGPYRWWAIAVSSANVRSYWTQPFDIFIGGRTDVLGPSGTIGETQPTITWRTVDGAARYELWVDWVGVETGFINRTDLTTTSFVPGLPLSTGTYRVWVRTVSVSEQFSPWSLSETFTIAKDDGVVPLPEGAFDFVPVARAIPPGLTATSEDCAHGNADGNGSLPTSKPPQWPRSLDADGTVDRPAPRGTGVELQQLPRDPLALVWAQSDLQDELLRKLL